VPTINYAPDLDLSEMNTKGFSVGPSRRVWGEEEVSVVRGILNDNHDSRKQDAEGFDLVFRTIEGVRQMLPGQVAEKLLCYLKWLQETLNRHLGPSEGPLRITKVLIRQYSRKDLIEELHIHQSGIWDRSYIGVNKSEVGLNSVVSEDSGATRTTAPEGSILFFSENGRAEALEGKIVPTLHGSPLDDTKRLVIFVEVQSDLRLQHWEDTAQQIFDNFLAQGSKAKDISVPDLISLLDTVPFCSNWGEYTAKIVLKYIQLRADYFREMARRPESSEKWRHVDQLQTLVSYAEYFTKEVLAEVKRLSYYQQIELL